MHRVEQQQIEPRGFSRIQAAAYIGVSPTLFDEMVTDGRMPQLKRINTRIIWDKRALDEGFEALPQETDQAGEDWTAAV